MTRRDAARYFSADYASARQRFRTAASAAGARLEVIPIDAGGPDGGDLTIDIAWLGPPDPQDVIVHCSGLHGVEGFAGSAIQLALLDAPPALPPSSALILVHALNPYGMAWLRRANERNVDLNRNFIVDDGERQGAPDGYRRLDDLLNPRTPPSRDGFLPRAALAVLRHGFRPVKQAIVEGQYQFDRGLFFGGWRLEQGPERYWAWLRERLGGVGRGVVVDVHTGLGRRGRESLFLAAATGSVAGWESELGRRVYTGDGGVGYRIMGGHSEAYAALPGRFVFFTQEFGTEGPLRVLHALREENRWHHYGDGTVEHPAKRRLLEAFAPRSPSWRSRVVWQGVSLVQRLAALGG